MCGAGSNFSNIAIGWKRPNYGCFQGVYTIAIAPTLHTSINNGAMKISASGKLGGTAASGYTLGW